MALSSVACGSKRYHITIIVDRGWSNVSIDTFNNLAVTLSSSGTHPGQHLGSAAFSQLVAKAFTMRRKTIRNGLRGLLEVRHIEAAGVDPGSRPEELGLEQFLCLARQLRGHLPVSG